MKYRTSECRHEHTSILTAVHCWKHSSRAEIPPHVYECTGECLNARDAMAVRIAHKMTLTDLRLSMRQAKEQEEEIEGRRQLVLKGVT